MSYEAIVWALRDAPDVPPQCVGSLFGLAHHADKQGRGAFPSALTLSGYARKSQRQVRYDLALLVGLGLIRPGDQSLTGDLPQNRRPMVYDLAMERVAGVQSGSPQGVQPVAPQADLGVQPDSPQADVQPIAPQTGSDLHESPGVQPTAPQVSDLLGCNTASPGVKPIAPKLTTNLNPLDVPVGADSSGTTTAAENPGVQPVAPQRRGQRKHDVADELAAAFWEHHKSATAQPFLAIRGVIRTAIANGLPRNDVARALDKLARERRPVSGGTITVALGEIRGAGQRNGSRPASPSAPDRARGWMDAGLGFEAEGGAGR